jgi:hypothetical protein
VVLEAAEGHSLAMGGDIPLSARETANLAIPSVRLYCAEASRRDLLRGVACTVAGGALASAADIALAAKGKKSHADVAYRDTPTGIERYEICTSFLPPDQCRTVVGPVRRQGWCNIYTGP